jgi:vacuolar protein sorting-associated protein 13A/C
LKGGSPEPQKQGDLSWMDEMVTRIVENLQIFVDDIHIRYEDTVSSPIPFSFGITLEGAHFQSADENWAPTTTFETGRPVINKVRFYYSCSC